MRRSMLEALEKKYEAVIAEADATINVYLSNSVGIGEHSDLSAEIHIWTSKLSEAIENINNLEKYFTEDGYGVNKNKKLLND